jgi:hypothetical protein
MEVNEGKEVIASGNEVLCQFMKGVHHQHAEIYLLDVKLDGTRVYDPSEFKYHKEFNWLMPVWYKFRDLKFEGFHGHRISHENFVFRISAAILHKDSPEPAFNELVKGIDWYNTIKQ